MSQFFPRFRTSLRASLLGAAVATASALTSAAHAASPAAAEQPLQGIERRPAEIQGTSPEIAPDPCPPVAAVPVTVQSSMAVPVEYSGPVVPVSQLGQEGTGGSARAMARGTRSKLRGHRALSTGIRPVCPAPLVLADLQDLAPVPGPSGGAFIPAAGISPLLGLLAAPVGIVPFLGGDTDSPPIEQTPPPGPPLIPTPPITPTPPIPEPATWLMMIFGFFTVGTALRRLRHGRTVAASAVCTVRFGQLELRAGCESGSHC